ncbi:hypothetical protein HNR59_003741 [Aquamicrobium lusatiense]|uniref:Uncharacterized protein n=1 Tax=Aquamicrobium lusatiense TaxID=89772 RepID=A0A7W9S589_9HYPH|nr:hypothetical protein [Aquamicrobium lusatiense]MBB6014347.1 hypothetical protein [Aquamicrobium lusatiense]
MTRASAQRLQRRQQRRQVDPESILAAQIDKMRKRESGANPDKLARQMVKRAWSEALRRAHGCLGISVGELFTLEILPDGAELATIDCSKPPFTVRVSAGLPPFIYRISRLLAARSSPFTSDAVPRKDDDSWPPFEESVERLHRAFFWYSATGHSTIHQDYQIDGNQAVVGGWLATEAEIFLMCHEIAHGLIARLPVEAPDLLANLEAGLEDMSEAWREEFVADRLALFLAIGQVNGSRDGHRLAMAYAGWEFALLLHREWERYEEVARSEQYFFETHPPAGDRIENLRGSFQRCLPTEDAAHLLSAAESISTLFRNLVDTMFSPEFQAALVERDEARARRLKELAIDCNKGPVPDYSRYVPEAIIILQQAESWTLLDLVLELTAPLRGEKPLDVTNFGVAKLVWRACEDLPDPLYLAVKKVTAMPDLVDRRARYTSMKR